MVVASGELPRVLAALDALPDPLRWLGWSDLLATYIDRGLAGGHRPYFDVPFEYPPLIGYPAGLFAVIAGSAAAYLACWAVVIVGVASITAFVLAREAGTRRALWRWALAPQLLLFAGMNVDLLPVALTVTAAVLARRRRMVGATFALALGTAAKLFPAIAVPALVVRDGRRALPLIAVFLGTVAIVFLPSVLAPSSSLSGVAYYLSGYQAGGIAVWGLVRAALDGIGVPGAASIVLVLTLAGLAATYVFAVVPRSRAVADPAVGIALAVIAVLFWSRLYSPQFSLWVLPFFALLPALRRTTFILLAVADSVVFVGVSQLTLVQRPADDPAGSAFLVAVTIAVVLRHVALIGMWRDVSMTAPATASGAG